jgi:uncharacterized membrane protein
LATIFFVMAGTNHFIQPKFYRQIVPPMFPAPGLLVIASGICEIAGGIGLQIRSLRPAAGWGLIALLVAVFPANVYMVVSPQAATDIHVSKILLWLRLPLQGVFIIWVWFVSRGD